MMLRTIALRTSVLFITHLVPCLAFAQALSSVPFSGQEAAGLFAAQVGGEITFSLDQITNPGIDGQQQITLTNGNIMLIVAASGDDSAVLDANDTGAGVQSDLDGAPNASEGRRVDGTVGEELHISLNCRVELTGLEVGALSLSGNESVRLRFVSGTNPFATLTTYGIDGNDLFSLQATALSYRSAGVDTRQLTNFGTNGREPIILEEGTVIGLSAVPSLSGGVLFNLIKVSDCLENAPDDAGVDGGNPPDTGDTPDVADAGVMDSNDIGSEPEDMGIEDTGIDLGIEDTPLIPDPGCQTHSGGVYHLSLWILIVFVGLAYRKRRRNIEQ